MSNLKVEGKVGDFRLKCKNCKAVTRIHDGKNASIRIIEVDCEDPYDGMVKTLDVDSDICCSMFEPKSDNFCGKRERFDGTYCHGPEGTISISYKALFGEPVNCPSYEEKKEKEPCDKISCLQHELEMDKLRRKIHELEKEKAAHMKGIERLKKSQEKLQNQVKNLQTTNEESYKREEKLEDKVHKLERRLLEENKRFGRLNTEFLVPLVHILYPGEKVCKPYPEILKDIKLLNKGVYDLKEDNKRLADSWKRDYERLRDQFIYPIYNILYPDKLDLDINVTDLLNYVKDLKVYANENGSMYKEIQEWREKCISRGNDIDHLLSENKEKDKKIGELESRKEECEKRYRDEISKLQNIVTEKEVEIKGLRKDNVRLSKDISWGNMIAEKNTELNQTIPDQEVTIKALLITIKEMCKEDETNE